MANIQSILAELIQERDRISQAIVALESLDGIDTRPSTSARQGHTVSAVARRRMAEAQRARRAREQKSSSHTKATAPRRTMSAEAIEKIRRAKKKWWKAKKASA